MSNGLHKGSCMLEHEMPPITHDHKRATRRGHVLTSASVPQGQPVMHGNCCLVEEQASVRHN